MFYKFEFSLFLLTWHSGGGGGEAAEKLENTAIKQILILHASQFVKGLTARDGFQKILAEEFGEIIVNEMHYSCVQNDMCRTSIQCIEHKF